MESEKIKKILSRLQHYYSEAEKLIADECSPNSLTPALKKINSYIAYLEKTIIELSNSSESSIKNKLEKTLEEQRAKRSQFDSKVTESLECNDVTSVEISSMLSVPRLLRSQRSLTITTTSSYKMAQALADEQVALLKVSHIEKQLSLEREEAEMKHKHEIEQLEQKRKREMLKAKQLLDEASLQRQVLEEETDRGGYISPASSTSSKIASQFSLNKSSPSKGSLQISKLFESLNDKNTSQPSQIAESSLGDVDGPTSSKTVHSVKIPGGDPAQAPFESD